MDIKTWIQQMALYAGNSSIISNISSKSTWKSVGDVASSNNSKYVVISLTDGIKKLYLSLSGTITFVPYPNLATVFDEHSIGTLAGAPGYPISGERYGQAVLQQLDYIINELRWSILPVAHKNKELYEEMFPFEKCAYDKFTISVQAEWFENNTFTLIPGLVACECETSEEEKEKWRKEHPLAQ